LLRQLAQDITQQRIAVGQLADDGVVLLAVMVEQAGGNDLHLNQCKHPL
jgi:hypothetical protein